MSSEFSYNFCNQYVSNIIQMAAFIDITLSVSVGVFIIIICIHFIKNKQNISRNSTLLPRLSVSYFIVVSFANIAYLFDNIACLLHYTYLPLNRVLQSVVQDVAHFRHFCIIIGYTLTTLIFVVRLKKVFNGLPFDYPKYVYILIVFESSAFVAFFIIGSILQVPIQILTDTFYVFVILNNPLLSYLFVNRFQKAIKQSHLAENLIQLNVKYIFLSILSGLASGTWCFFSALDSIILNKHIFTLTIAFASVPFDWALNSLAIYLQYGFTEKQYKKLFSKCHRCVTNVFIKNQTDATSGRSLVNINSVDSPSEQHIQLTVIHHTDIDESIFNDSIHNKTNYMDRLCEALNYYRKVSASKFTDFCKNRYKDLLDDTQDFAHSELGNVSNLKKIQQLLFTKYKIVPCDSLKNCVFTARHYRNKDSSKYICKPTSKLQTNATFNDDVFYSDIMDTLHFNIFHLFDAGMRYESDEKIQQSEVMIKLNEIVENKIEYNCIDNAFANTGIQYVSNNKYIINMGFQATSEWTWSDMMFNYMTQHEVDEKKIKKVEQFLREEEYDTDSILYEFENCEFGMNIKDNENDVCYIPQTIAIKITSVISDFVHRSQAQSFDTGLTFWYWDYYDPQEFKLREEEKKEYVQTRFNVNDYGGYSIPELYVDNPKYNSLKNEILESGFCSVKLFEQIKFKSIKLSNSARARQLRANADGVIDIYKDLHYNIRKNDLLKRRHLQALICYCDYSDLCSAFSATFRPMYYGEPLKQIKQRNRLYFHLSKLLREAVEYFGNKGALMNKIQSDMNNNLQKAALTNEIRESTIWHEQLFGTESGPFFCGISQRLIIPKFNIRLCGPTSTSKQKSVAIKFAQRSGMIMQLNNTEDWHSRNLRFFDCSWISRYVYEDERLFFGGYLRIQVESVIIIRTKENFCEWFKAIFYFDSMLNSSAMDANVKITLAQRKALKQLTLQEISGNKNNKIHPYIADTFHLFCQNQRKICINFAYIEKHFHEISDEILFNVDRDPCKDSNSLRNLFKPLVFKLFPNIKKISIFSTYGFGKDQQTYSLSFAEFNKCYSNRENNYLNSFKTSTEIEILAVQNKRGGNWIESYCKTKSIAQQLSNFDIQKTTTTWLDSDSIGNYHRYFTNQQQKQFTTITISKRKTQQARFSILLQGALTDLNVNNIDSSPSNYYE